MVVMNLVGFSLQYVDDITMFGHAGVYQEVIVILGGGDANQGVITLPLSQKKPRCGPFAGAMAVGAVGKELVLDAVVAQKIHCDMTS